MSSHSRGRKRLASQPAAKSAVAASSGTAREEHQEPAPVGPDRHSHLTILTPAVMLDAKQALMRYSVVARAALQRKLRETRDATGARVTPSAMQRSTERKKAADKLHKKKAEVLGQQIATMAHTALLMHRSTSCHAWTVTRWVAAKPCKHVKSAECVSA